MKNVVCIGSALKDIFFPTGDGVVIQTPDDITAQKKITFELGAKYRVENRYVSAGGGALNLAIGLSRLGITAAPYALIGGDATGMWIRDILLKNGVDTGFIRQVTEAQSDLSMILVDRKSGERVIFVNRDLQETLQVDGSSIVDGSVLFVSALSGMWRENCNVIKRLVKEKKCILAYNPGQSNITEGCDDVCDMIASTQYLFVNRDEAIEIALKSGMDANTALDVKNLLRFLRKKGAQTIVMTAGLDGAWMYYEDTIFYIQSSDAHPLDTTGAGDSFSSGVLAALLHGERPEVAMTWGAANAARVIMAYGSNKGLMTKGDIFAIAKALESHVKRVA